MGEILFHALQIAILVVIAGFLFGGWYDGLK